MRFWSWLEDGDECCLSDDDDEEDDDEEEDDDDEEEDDEFEPAEFDGVGIDEFPLPLLLELPLLLLLPLLPALLRFW